MPTSGGVSSWRSKSLPAYPAGRLRSCAGCPRRLLRTSDPTHRQPLPMPPARPATAGSTPPSARAARIVFKGGFSPDGYGQGREAERKPCAKLGQGRAKVWTWIMSTLRGWIPGIPAIWRKSVSFKRALPKEC